MPLYAFTAEQIINEGRITREEIDEITAWCPSQNLPAITDEQAVNFHISCSNNMEETKTKIRWCYKLCAEAPDISTNRDANREDLQRQSKVWPIFVVPAKTDDKSAVVFSRLGDTYYRNLELAPVMTLMSMTMDATYYDYPPTGLIVVCDMEGLGIMHLTRMTFRLVKIFFEFAQEAFPLKLKEVHMLNTVYFIDKVLAILRPFIHSKLLDLIYFHPHNTDMEDFTKKWVPKRCLPEDYGGDLPHSDILNERHYEKLKQMWPYFKAEEEQREAVSSYNIFS